MRRSCVRAYARGVTRLGASRWCSAPVLALALLTWSAASGSSAEHIVVPSSPADAVAIESVPTLLVTTSDRPVSYLLRKLGEGQRALSIMAVSPAIGVPATVARNVRSSRSVLSAGPVAQGLAGRGPPSFGNA